MLTNRKGKKTRKQSSFVRFNSMPGRYEPPQPGPFDASITITKRFRFIATAASTGVIISAEQMLAMFCMGTGTGSVNGIPNGVRLKKVKLWGPTVAALTPVTVSLQWISSPAVTSFGGSQKRISDTSMGSTFPAYITAAPEKDTIQAQWLTAFTGASEQSLFLISFPANSIVDVSLDYRITGTPGLVTTVASSAGGQLYILALDNAQSGGTNNLVPVSFPTTV